MKQSIENIKINNFDYNLPKESIALHPLEKRDDSKLIYINKEKEFQHFIFKDIDTLIPSDSLLIVNSTKVIAARLNFYKSTGAKVEILCVDPISPSNDPQITLMNKQKCTWQCIIGGRRVREESILTINMNGYSFNAKILKRYENKAEVEFYWDKDITFAQAIDEVGKLPLPPYINRDVENEDKDRYQTVYANYEGSIAAPTAGLHFTDEVLTKLKNKNISRCELILHVGPGTFQPISVENVIEHNMHFEQIFIFRDRIEEIINFLKSRKNNAKLVATGTTSLRILETLYWIGIKIHHKLIKAENDLILNMMDAYNLDNENLTFENSLEIVLNWMKQNNLTYINIHTQLFIMPGYKVISAEMLITNFHLPKSTLLLLVSAFIGSDKWKDAYKAALENNYRFLSYGDSSLIERGY